MTIGTDNNLDQILKTIVKNYCTPSPLRYALTIKNPVGSGTTM
jgi:hypothetical protein